MAVMVHYSGKSLWGDSIGTIFIASPVRSLLETLKIDVTQDVFVAPIFYLVANVWLKIAPYGTMWVKLLCEIFICAGIIITSLSASQIFGKWEGIFTCLYLCVCSYLITQGAYEFRCYALWFVFTAMLVMSHEKKIKDPTPGNLLLFGIIAVLTCYTHFNGVLFFFTMFLWDLFLWLRRKISIRHISSYLIWGLLFFPYLVYAYFHATEMTEGFWPKPSAADFLQIDTQLLIEPLLYGIFWVSVLWGIFKVFKGKSEKTAFILWLVAGYKTVNFIYSNLNRGYSMWIPRYFFCQITVMMILCGCFTADICRRSFSKGSRIIKIICCMAVCCCFIFLEILYVRDLRAHRYPEVIHQPFEQAAEVLRQQDDFWNEDTAFYYSAYNIEAWQYYLAHGDMTPGLLNLLPMDLNADIDRYQVIYVCELQNAMPEGVWEKLTRSFEYTELHHDYKIFRFTKRTDM